MAFVELMYFVGKKTLKFQRLPRQKRMTICIGLRASDGIVIAADAEEGDHGGWTPGKAYHRSSAVTWRRISIALRTRETLPSPRLSGVVVGDNAC